MLKQVGLVSLPWHAAGGYDHADVIDRNGKVYIAHTANGTVEVVDGEGLGHLATIPGCPEASGVLCDQGRGLVFAASRGAGKVLVIDSNTDKTVREIPTGPKPNGLAWDSRRRHLLVADVEDDKARLFDSKSGENLGELVLRGRPRWAVYEPRSDMFFVNIRDPALVDQISPGSIREQRSLPVSVQGPHGLGVIEGGGRAFVACDGRSTVVLDLADGKELAVIPLSGEPDVVWLNPTKNLLYCAEGRPGIIDVVDTDRFVVTEKVATEEGAHTLAFDNRRQRLYAFLPKSQRAVVYSEG